MNNTKVRQSNLELCRIVAILLVVLLHSNFGWCGWPSSIDDCNIPMLFVEAFAIVGVNVFVMITGYFSTNLKTKSIINLFYICLFYAVVRLLYGVQQDMLIPRIFSLFPVLIGLSLLILVCCFLHLCLMLLIGKSIAWEGY